jgi:hypothetical protein
VSQVSAFWNAQQQAYLQPGSAGWIIWTLKMEDGGIWSLEDCYYQVPKHWLQSALTVGRSAA